MYVWDAKGRRYLDGLAGLFVYQARSRPHELAEAAAEAGRRARVLPALDVRPPQCDRARRAGRVLRPRRPQPGVLHHRRRRGRRDRVEARQEVLQADRQADEAQGHQPPDRLPRHPQGALSITGIPALKQQFEPLVPSTFRVPNTNFYRAPEHGDDLDDFGMLGRRPDRSTRSWPRVRTRSPRCSSSRCRTPAAASRPRPATSSGCARSATGTTYCWSPTRSSARSAGSATCSAPSRYGYLPDMITCAKGITSGYSPLGAMIASDRLMEPFLQGDNRFAHGYTFGGHPVSTAVAMAQPRDLRAGRSSTRTSAPTRARSGRRWRSCSTSPSSATYAATGTSTASSWSRTRRPRRRSRRGVRAAAARLPVQGAVRRTASTAAPTTAATRSSSSLRRSSAEQEPLRRDGADPPRRPRRRLEHL